MNIMECLVGDISWSYQIMFFSVLFKSTFKKTQSLTLTPGIHFPNRNYNATAKLDFSKLFIICSSNMFCCKIGSNLSAKLCNIFAHTNHIVVIIVVFQLSLIFYYFHIYVSTVWYWIVEITFYIIFCKIRELVEIYCNWFIYFPLAIFCKNYFPIKECIFTTQCQTRRFLILWKHTGSTLHYIPLEAHN